MKRSALAITDRISRRSTTRSACLSRGETRCAGSLEASPDGLFDDAGAGESDQRLRFGDVQVAEHREARGDAAGRRVGQHRDGGSRSRSRRARAPQIFAICISERALHHPGASRAADHHHRAPRFDRPLDRARFLADPTPMLPPMNSHPSRRDDRLHAVDRSGRGDDGVLQPVASRPAFSRFLLLGVGKPQRIGRDQPAVISTRCRRTASASAPPR